MWKYYDKMHNKEFILSLNLVPFKISDDKKLNLLYAISNNSEKYYHKKEILKKDGTKRFLLVPNKNLKIIQKNILNHVLKGLSVSKYATAYVNGKSIKDNVYEHVDKKIILKLDIKDFFDNITFLHIYNALPNYLFPPALKVLLIKLCTYKDYLPQGAPTSPYLSNLVMKRFDDYIGKYCFDKDISYSRYSDDLTFSGDFEVKKMINKVDAFLNEMGFSLNTRKTRVLRKNQKQIITGIVVNKKVNTSKNYRKDIRQKMYYINKFGLNNVNSYIGSNITYLSLLGKINYGLFLDLDNKELKTYQKRIKSML